MHWLHIVGEERHIDILLNESPNCILNRPSLHVFLGHCEAGPSNSSRK